MGAEGRSVASRSELLAPASKFECALAEIEKFLVVDLLRFSMQRSCRDEICCRSPAGLVAQ
jgi:hypothetical protein